MTNKNKKNQTNPLIIHVTINYETIDIQINVDRESCHSDNNFTNLDLKRKLVKKFFFPPLNALFTFTISKFAKQSLNVSQRDVQMLRHPKMWAFCRVSYMSDLRAWRGCCVGWALCTVGWWSATSWSSSDHRRQTPVSNDPLYKPGHILNI